ncbi:MAG: penicillin-binding protein 1C [Alphaproteobacteria bacterium]|nr:penicillin-binding protein 1C [Alphaproteobacteria bacterium]
MRTVLGYTGFFTRFFPRSREKRLPWLVPSVALIACLVTAVYYALPAPALDRSRSASVLVLAADGSILRGFLTSDGKWRLPVEPEAVDPLYRRMLIAAEDRRFAAHPGVDPIAAARALFQLVLSGRVVSGASTLTMQAVRLLEPHPRSLVAKLAEMAKALALERLMSKNRVLSLYLTLGPFGGNLEGVRAASLAYFGKEPVRLSVAEAALLVAIPRSPERLRPDRHPDAARAARDRVLERMADQHVISTAALTEARDQEVPSTRLAMPFRAPHLARDLRDEKPQAAVHRTTIDSLLQQRVEALLGREVSGLDRQANLAAVVVDNRDRRVLAYAGSADFASAARRGTLDMARALRSPGSALKPFIYAIGFDRLIIHPETVLEDRPRNFGDYSPSDFDGRFQGEVTAREALQYSLNLPAVGLLDRVGPGRFTAALAAAGIRLRLPRPAAEPGLAVALGGGGITLLDLVRLYSALSNGGEVAPLRYRADEPTTSGTAIFGPLAAWYVNGILAEAPPPPGVLPAEIRRGRRFAFKTGTSYGYRDFWAIGYDPEVTIGVWAGRPDGTPMPGHSGRLTAAPVLFKIADLLGPSRSRDAIPPPPGTLLLSRNDLPPRLRRLEPRAPAPAQPGGPKIVYPPDGALIEWRGEEVPLEAIGGKGPLQWLVDGRPLPPDPPRRGVYWQPDEIGFVQLSVIDAAGRSAHSTVRLSR